MELGVLQNRDHGFAQHLEHGTLVLTGALGTIAIIMLNIKIRQTPLSRYAGEHRLEAACRRQPPTGEHLEMGQYTDVG